MKYCPSCATSLDDNVRECPQCGHMFVVANSGHGTPQRPGNENVVPAANYAELKMNQPPAYSVSPVTPQNTTNNSNEIQAVPKWKKLLPLFIVISVIVTIVQGCIIGLSNSESQETSTEHSTTTTEKAANLNQRNGFDNNTNEIVNLGGYVFEIPAYWNDDETQRVNSDSLQKHVAKTETEESFVRLLYLSSDDPDNKVLKYYISYKDEAAKSIAEGIEASKYSLIRQEIITFGDATGLLTVLDVSINKNGTAYEAQVYHYMFASVENHSDISIMLTMSHNSKYSYTEDFFNILKSIKKFDGSYVDQTETSEEWPTATTKATPTPVPKDITKKGDTRFAFKNTASDYTIYYIIDFSERKVYYFTSKNPKPTIGTFEGGNLKKSITVKYPYDGGTDVISYYKGNSNRIVVHDQNGFNWYYDICYISEADNVITK